MQWYEGRKKMIFYFILTCITILMAATVRQQKQEVFCNCGNHGYRVTRQQGKNVLGLTAIFILLFLPAALRLQVGNDYESYVDTIHEIYVGGYVVTEPLFNLIVKVLCELSGGENYLLVFAFFSFITIFLFLKVLYEQSENFFPAFFLFMTLGIYFRTYNTMRYYLVLAITMYSYRFILRKEYMKFIVLIVLSSFLHKSVLVVIPLYFMAVIPWKKWFLFLMFLAAAFSLLFREFILQIALQLYPSYKDTVFLETETGIGGNVATIIRCILVILAVAATYEEAIRGKKENEFYLKLNVLALFVYTCGSFLPLVGRIGYYLITSQILLLPSLFFYMKKSGKRKLFMGITVILTVLYFVNFLRTADEPGVRVLPYRTWLFYEKEFLNAETIF